MTTGSLGDRQQRFPAVSRAVVDAGRHLGPGLGKLNDSDALGLHFHTTIAVQLNGMVRGLLHQSLWSRSPEAEPKAKDRRQRPIEDKESYKWLEGIEAAKKTNEEITLSADDRKFYDAYSEHWVHAEERTILTQHICRQFARALKD